MAATMPTPPPRSRAPCATWTQRGRRHTIAIVGLRARKDADAFIGALASSVDQIIAVPLTEAHVAPATDRGKRGDTGYRRGDRALARAAMQNAAQLPAPRVLICGSFLLAAEALAAESA